MGGLDTWIGSALQSTGLSRLVSKDQRLSEETKSTDQAHDFTDLNDAWDKIRRRTPPSQLSRKRDELPVRAPDTSSSARARISSLRADAQRNPEARQFRRGATRPRGSASRR
ncbi:hypothetical protein JEQ12_002533 [Ovis aries]|uniref:Uncharacterized protein n=1 Tax=Ovis aries TaxID=9940 RepID=A0A835ZW96_SHEEP|nr:hypothetical protein JEQ12_002533 [Ovis aries]